MNRRQNYRTEGPTRASTKVGGRRGIDLKRLARERCQPLDDLKAAAAALDRNRSAAA